MQGVTRRQMEGTPRTIGTQSLTIFKSRVKLKKTVVFTILTGPYPLKTTVVTVTNFRLVTADLEKPKSTDREITVLFMLFKKLETNMLVQCTMQIPTFNALVVRGRLLIECRCKLKAAPKTTKQ